MGRRASGTARAVIWWILSLDLARFGVFGDNPTFCVRSETQTYDCNCYECCHQCNCYVRADFWHGCDGCGTCWCSPGCKCCGRTCCGNCCQSCQRVVCAESVEYSVSHVVPSGGPVTGGTIVRVIGGVFSNLGTVKCRFGDVVVEGSMLTAAEIHCVSPAQHNTTRRVTVEVSLDGGAQWTNNGLNFTYINCPGGGICSGNGVCHPDSRCTCNAGYYGDACDQVCPGGSASPCSGRSALGTCNAQGNCTCTSGYYGMSCEFECPGGAQNACSQHGLCLSSGDCRCDQGYLGTNCSRQGTCNGTQCQCYQGYYGPGCALECHGSAALNCNSGSGQGVCGPDGHCYCSRGYWGDVCQYECPGGAANPCNGRGEEGTCSSSGDCHCRSGYYGQSCSLECPGGASNPCNGRGVCGASGHCMCDAGYAGAACERECPGGPFNACNGRGSCDDDTGLCTCNSSSYYGAACENVCGCRSDRGVCDEAGACTCFSGFFGDTCEMSCPVAPNGHPCGNEPGKTPRGVCDHTTQQCLCRQGWWGPSCAWTCPGGSERPCSSHGICRTTDGTCKCNPGYAGATCSELACPHDCFGHGTCNAGVCACESGYLPPYCADGGNNGSVVNASDAHGAISFAVGSLYVNEYVEEVYLSVMRTRGAQGRVSATVNTQDETTVRGLDYVGMNKVTVEWGDGDAGPKNVSFTVIQDAIAEQDESFRVFLSSVDGGATYGAVRSVHVVIQANNVSRSTERLAVEIKFRLTRPISDLPELSHDRALFQNAFVDDLASALHISNRRILFEYLSADAIGTIVRVKLLPSLDEQRPQVLDLATRLIELAKNATGPLYRGTATQYVDIRYAPELLQASAAPVDGGDDDRTTAKTAGIVVGVVASVAFITIGALCYTRRKAVAEWMLYKLGNFRFRTLKEEKSIQETELQPAGDGELVGESAPDAMPLEDDFHFDDGDGETSFGDAEFESGEIG